MLDFLVLWEVLMAHIKISPPADRHNEYLDRTWKHSVTLHAVCDAKKNSLGLLQDLLAVFMTKDDYP